MESDAYMHYPTLFFLPKDSGRKQKTQLIFPFSRQSSKQKEGMEVVELKCLQAAFLKQWNQRQMLGSRMGVGSLFINQHMERGIYCGICALKSLWVPAECTSVCLKRKALLPESLQGMPVLCFISKLLSRPC